MWTAEAARVLSYTPSALISLGLSAEVPPRSVLDRDGQQLSIKSRSPLILWADVIGAKPGDAQLFEIAGPDGQVIHRQESTLTDGGLSWFAYSGKRALGGNWPFGRYIGKYSLTRGNKVIIKASTVDAISE
jgi:hypothetical protein